MIKKKYVTGKVYIRRVKKRCLHTSCILSSYCYSWDDIGSHIALYVMPQLYIALKYPVWGFPNCIFEEGSSKILGTICLAAVRCGWPLLWDNLCLHWVQLMCALFPETSSLREGVPAPTVIFFINFQNIIWRAKPKSARKSTRVLNWNGACRPTIDKVGNVFYLVFSWVILWSSVRSNNTNTAVATQWPLRHAQ